MSFHIESSLKPAFSVVIGSPVINAGKSFSFSFSLTANIASVPLPIGMAEGQRIAFLFLQDATGGRTVGFNAGYLLPNGLNPVRLAPNAVTLLYITKANASYFVSSAGIPDYAVGPYAFTAPATLTDLPTIALDASLSLVFNLTLTGNHTLGAPTNPKDGQEILIRVKQDPTGSRTLAYDAVWRFGTTISSITLTTTPGKTDYIRAVYNAADLVWDIIDFKAGY